MMMSMLLVFSAFATVMFLTLALITVFFDRVRAKRLAQLGLFTSLLLLLVFFLSTGSAVFHSF